MISFSLIVFFTAFKFAGLDFPSLQFNSGMSQLSVPTQKVDKEGQPLGFDKLMSGRTFIVFSNGATQGFPPTVPLNCDLAGGLAATTERWGSLKFSDEGPNARPPKVSDGSAVELNWSKSPQIQIVNSDLPVSGVNGCDKLVGRNGHLLPTFILLDATKALTFLANFILLMIMFVVVALTVSLTRAVTPVASPRS